MPRGPGPLAAPAELAAVRDPGPAGGRTAQALQGVGHDLAHVRGGPGAVRSRARREHCDALQGAWHICRPEGLAYALQARRVSTALLFFSFFFFLRSQVVAMLFH